MIPTISLNCWPVPPDFENLSEPAKSTRFSLDLIISPESMNCSREIENIECDLDDCSFSLVYAVVLLIPPLIKQDSISFAFFT